MRRKDAMHGSAPGSSRPRRRSSPTAAGCRRYCTAGEHAIAQAENVPCTCWPSLVLFVQLLPEDARSVEVARLESPRHSDRSRGQQGCLAIRDRCPRRNLLRYRDFLLRAEQRVDQHPRRRGTIPFKPVKTLHTPAIITPHNRQWRPQANQRRSPPRRLERHNQTTCLRRLWHIGNSSDQNDRERPSTTEHVFCSLRRAPTAPRPLS